jgi:hypothetical protein
MDGPLDIAKRVSAVVQAAPWSVLSLIVLASGLTFTFVKYIESASLSAKDSTIENLKTRVDSLQAEKNAAPDVANSQQLDDARHQLADSEKTTGELRKALSAAAGDARKWQFSRELRNGAKG